MQNRFILAKEKRSLVILILGLLSTIGPFSIDMYLPGFSSIAANLHTTTNIISYSLASFFIGICIGQLVAGPLLDRFGRKKPLIIGSIIYILASLGCALSDSVEILIALRFFQAIGCCVSMIAPRAIVRDLFPVQESPKIFSLLILVISLSPIIAPTLGSFIVISFGWSHIFIILAIITALILAATILWLPESQKSNPDFSLKMETILRSYIKVSKNPQFYTYALTAAVSFGGLFAYLSGSPFVFMEFYGVSTHQYALIFAIIAAGIIGSSQLNNLLLRKLNSAEVIIRMSLSQAVIGLCLLIGTLTNMLGLSSTILLIFLYVCCLGFIFPNSSALSMAPFKREAGSASALMGSIQMACGALSAGLVGYLSDKTSFPMILIMCICSTCALTILLMGRRKIIARAHNLREETLDMIEKI